MIIVGQEATFTPPDYKPEIYGYIYKITNKINGKIYVGQTTQTVAKRWSWHKWAAASGSNYPLYKSMRKYCNDNFIIDIIDTARTIDELNNREAYWIANLAAMSPKGYNLKPGGNQLPLTDKVKAKIAAATRKQMSDPAARKRISDTQRGRKRTEAQKIAISLSKKGKKLNITEEGRQKKRDRMLNTHPIVTDEQLEKRGSRWFRVFLKDGTIIGDFINKEKCGRALGVTQSMVSDWVHGKKNSITYDFAYINPETSKIIETIGDWARIIVHTIDGHFIGKFLDKASCAQALGASEVDISRWTLGKVKSRKYTFRIINAGEEYL